MNIKHFRLVSIFLAVFGLTASYTAQAQEVKVLSADPSSALQGTQNLDVTVQGDGFDNSATVQFLVSGTANPGGVIVKGVKVRGQKKLIVNVDVLDDAEVAEFDIEVQLSRGRGGKGTTLFKVLQNNGGGVNDLLTISLTQPLKNASISVYDVEGRLVKVQTLTYGNQMTVSCKGFARGLYFYRIASAGSEAISGKFVKE